MKQLDIPAVFTLAWFCDVRQASNKISKRNSESERKQDNISSKQGSGVSGS